MRASERIILECSHSSELLKFNEISTSHFSSKMCLHFRFLNDMIPVKIKQTKPRTTNTRTPSFHIPPSRETVMQFIIIQEKVAITTIKSQWISQSVYKRSYSKACIVNFGIMETCLDICKHQDNHSTLCLGPNP